MNYFAHGYRFLDDPWFLAGTALPDWLNVVDRKVRVRSKRAAPFCHDANPQTAALARGVLQHHQDDGWFHETKAFAVTSLELTQRVRKTLPSDDGFRPSFLGHIVVELLLDDQLIANDPERLERYYQAFSTLNLAELARVIEQIAGRPAPRLAEFVRLFVDARFLCDYAQDATLCLRLNQVMRRVGLPLLPESFREILPGARQLVEENRDVLLNRPS